MKTVHGGDTYGYQLEYGIEPIDFSANTSPLGMPENVKKAAIAGIDFADTYPDPLCRRLRGALSGELSVPVDNIFCGTGAADIIFRIVHGMRPKTAMVTAPAFSEYTSALQSGGCEVSYYELKEENGFHIAEDILEKLTPELDMLFLCEPNNPTGVTSERSLLQRIAEKCREQNILFVLDECFNDLLDEPEAHSLLPNLEKYRMVILRAFTKFYGMAGLRLGYCLCSSPDLVETIAAAGQPWPVSAPAQEAGIAALKERAYGETLRTLIRTEREFLLSELCKLPLRVIPGEANYILFYTEDHTLHEKLRHRGFMIRSCANYRALGEGWYRIAVRTRKDNTALLCAMKEVLL